MTHRSRWLALMLTAFSLFGASSLQAQTASIRSFTVEPVEEFTPGTELVFHVLGTAGALTTVSVEGAPGALTLDETKPGVYDGAYTVSVRDKFKYDSKYIATMKLGASQTNAVLAQSVLTDSALAKIQAKAAAAASPQISRFETGNSGSFTGGQSLTFAVAGTPGGKATVSLDGGKTRTNLSETQAGQYSAEYTIKTRDRLNANTKALATLTVGSQKATMSKTLAAGAVMGKAVAAVVCDTCGVVEAVTPVKVKGKASLLGAIGGAVAGGALGNQVGNGDGNKAATVVGAIGGAVAGREIEKRMKEFTRFDVLVKMQNGQTRTASFEAEPTFKVGDKVKFDGDKLMAGQ